MTTATRRLADTEPGRGEALPVQASELPAFPELLRVEVELPVGQRITPRIVDEAQRGVTR